MGDRGNVRVIEDGKSVYLYTHWHGEELPKIVQDVLGRKVRWDDAPYLTRMIFCAMVPEREWHEETGFGISTIQQDQDRPNVIVDTDKQIVIIGKREWTFEGFLH